MISFASTITAMPGRVVGTQINLKKNIIEKIVVFEKTGILHHHEFAINCKTL